MAVEHSVCLGFRALDMRFSYGSSSCSLQGKSYDKIDKTSCALILLRPPLKRQQGTFLEVYEICEPRSYKKGGVKLVAFEQSVCLGLCALDMRFSYGSSSCRLQGKSYDKIDQTRCSLIL